ncbi:MAG: ABC transporter permease [Trebonia sp.]
MTTLTPPAATTVGPPAPAPGGPAVAARMLGNETGKQARLLWRRRGLVIAGVFAAGTSYILFRLLIEGGHVTAQMVGLTLPGLVLGYAFAAAAALQGAGDIAEEVLGGTLEQSQLSPARPSLLLAGRLIGLAGLGLAGAVVLGLVFGFGFGVHYTIRPDVLVPLLLTILDGLGYALLMTALVLRVASTGAIVHVFNMAIMFFGGMTIPVSAFPHGVEIFARFVPTTLGVEAVNTTLAGRGLGAAWSDGTLPWLIVHTVALGALGWITYLHTLRRARREGGLSPR